eukprot:TRINITY_DN7648_c0_g1_i1.p1 TRINITY_DN7648_c0_g1~~TRINITY_DN7648_c0_g1_i1.p1  ORF type:complete len:1075 (-),score=228.50 TRINITY_DN7648_c0_g1_i1:109-3297(-)
MDPGDSSNLGDTFSSLSHEDWEQAFIRPSASAGAASGARETPASSSSLPLGSSADAAVLSPPGAPQPAVVRSPAQVAEPGAESAALAPEAAPAFPNEQQQDTVAQALASHAQGSIPGPAWSPSSEDPHTAAATSPVQAPPFPPAGSAAADSMLGTSEDLQENASRPRPPQTPEANPGQSGTLPSGVVQPADAAKKPEVPRSPSRVPAASLVGLDVHPEEKEPPKAEGEQSAALPPTSGVSARPTFTGAEVPPRYRTSVEPPLAGTDRRADVDGVSFSDGTGGRSDPSGVSRPPQHWETSPIMPPITPPPRVAETPPQRPADAAPKADRRSGMDGPAPCRAEGAGAWLVQGTIQPAEAARTHGSSQREPSPGLPSPARSSSPAPALPEQDRSGRGRAGRDSVSPAAREIRLFELLQEMRQTMWAQQAHPLQQQGQLPGMPMHSPPHHLLQQHQQHLQLQQLQQQQLQQQQWQQHQQQLQHLQQLQALNNPWPSQPSGSFQPMPPVQPPAPPAPEASKHQTPKPEVAQTSSKEVQVEPESRSRDPLIFQEFRAKQQQARQALPELRSARDDLARQVQAVEARSSELRQRCAEAEREGLEDFERLRCYLNSVEALKQGTLGRERDIRMQLIEGIDNFCRHLQQAEAAGGGNSEAVRLFLTEFPDVQSAADALCSRACSLPQVDVRIDDIPFEARSKNDKLRRYVVADRLMKAKDLCLWRLEQQRRRLAAEAQEGAEWIQHLGGLLDQYAEELGQVCYFCSERFCAAAANTRCPYNLGNTSLPDQRVPQQLWGAGVHFWVPLPAPFSAAAAVAQQSLGSAANEGPRPFAPLVEPPMDAPVDYGQAPAFPSSRHALASHAPAWREEFAAPSSSMSLPAASLSRFGHGWEPGGAVAQRADPICRDTSVAPPAGAGTRSWPSRAGGGGGGPLPPAPPPLPSMGLSSQLPLLPQQMMLQPMSHQIGQQASAPEPSHVLGDPAALELWQRLGRVLRERGVLARQAFAMFDADGNGAVSRPELFEAFRLMRLGLSESELERLMSDIDTNKDGLVNIQDFANRLQLMDLQASN